MSTRQQQVEELFAAALALPTETERAARLAEAEPDLRAEVESLLRAHAHPDAILSAGGGTVVMPTEAVGDRIGRYRLLEKIGEGGCGIVYVAEQLEPVRRRVALKVIKLGMDTRSVLARFEAERQALAMMDHPNIARVFDGGSSALGRPYFVMELVRGVPITDYCDQFNLPMAERLVLFAEICSAVQHAHQKGIIHRDLKPSNILVTRQDGVPVPKVIDFGIAKAVEGRLTDKTVYTELHQFVGTPAYMSPEQAGMSALDIDTRSDIYSLGVLLYELVTGHPPFDPQELLQAGLDEILRKVCHEDPPRPSTRLSRLQKRELTTVAQRRRAEAPRLIQLLRGDLDWVVMKCLEKDRSRRYQTAADLATDVRHHLSNEAVAARPPSAVYRVRKLAGKHRMAVAAVSALMAVLFAGIGATTWQAVRATRAERDQSQLRQKAERLQTNELALRLEAEAARKTAVDEAAIATAVSDFLRTDLLQSAGGNFQANILGIKPNPGLTILEALDLATDKVAERFQTQPIVEAAIRHTIGVTYNDLEEAWSAVPQLERALQLRETLLGPEHESTYDTRAALGAGYLKTHLVGPAENLLRRCFVHSERSHGNEEVCRAALELARVYVDGKKYKQAIDLLEPFAQLSGTNGARRTVAEGMVLSDLSLAHAWAGHATKAVAMQEEAWKIITRALEPEHPMVISAFHNLGACYLHLTKRTNDAVKCLEESLRLAKAQGPSRSSAALETRNYLVVAYQTLGRNDDARAMIQEANEISRRWEAKSPRERIRHLQVQADFMEARGQPAKAEELQRECATIARRPPYDFDRLEAGLQGLGKLLFKQKRFKEAEEVFSEFLATVRLQEKEDSRNIESPIYLLSETLYRQGKFAEAEPLYREHLERKLRRHLPSDDGIVGTKASIGRLLSEWAWTDQHLSPPGPSAPAVAHAKEGMQILRECLLIRRADTNASRGRLGDLQSRLGSAVFVQAAIDPSLTRPQREQQWLEAETLLLGGEDLIRESASLEAKYRRDSRRRLVQFYTHRSQIEPADAERVTYWRAQLAELDRVTTPQLEDASP